MAKILLVEDDRLLNQGIAFFLKKWHEVIQTETVAQGWDQFQQGRPDLAILDITLPDGSGLELCRKIRERSGVPLLFLTAKDTDQDMIQGFQAGCDDYIPKPFNLEVLGQRVDAVLRRSAPVKNELRQGDLTINFDKMAVSKAGKEVKLTATEYKLLAYLAQNKGQVMVRDALLQKVWDIDGNFVDENTLNVNIRRLRAKIEEDPKHPSYIITVFGIGYTWGEES